eukprot:12070913-Ditylum_brightwellii.AAC.2
MASLSSKGKELYLFGDNSTGEATYYQGSSSSKLLNELVLHMCLLEIQYGCIIHLIHCTGTRMIEQGTNGLSQGSINKGGMVGGDMLLCVPLNLTATEHHPLCKIGLWSGHHMKLSSYCLLIGLKKGGELGLWYPTLLPGTYAWELPPSCCCCSHRGALICQAQASTVYSHCIGASPYLSLLAKANA